MVSHDYQGRSLQLINSGGASFDYYTSSAYDCCAACFDNPNCYGASYGTGFDAVSCELLIGTSCPAAQGGVAGDYTNGADPSLALVFSNGPCGRYKYSES